MIDQVMNITISAAVLAGILYVILSQHKNLAVFSLIPGRNAALDIFKGVAILNIIFIHTYWWSGLQYIPNQSIGQAALFVDVPLFFFLSGWAATYKKAGVNDFFKRIIQIYIPYVLYGFVVVTLFFLIKKRVSSYEDIIRWLFLDFEPFLFSPLVGALWFIKVFLVISLFKPFLEIISRYKALGIFLITVLLTLNLLFGFRHNSGHDFILPSLSTPEYLTFYLFFYFLGIFTRNVYFEKAEFFLTISLLTVALVFYLHSGPNVFDIQKNKFPPRLLFLLCSLYSVFLVLLLKNFSQFFESKLTKSNIFKFLAISGQKVYSLFLYQQVGGTFIYYLADYLSFLHWLPLMILCHTTNIVVSISCAVFLDPVNRFFTQKTANCFLYMRNKIGTIYFDKSEHHHQAPRTGRAKTIFEKNGRILS